jgi:hypothetical protein
MLIKINGHTLGKPTVIYQVRQITQRATTKNKQDQVIVTMHASKLKMNTRTKHIRTKTQSL